MAEFFLEYSLFLAKTITIVVAIVIIIVMATVAASRKQTQQKENIEIRKLNQKYEDMATALNANIMPKDEFKKALKQDKQQQKKDKKEKKENKEKLTSRPRIFVLNFHGDIRASAVSAMREEITAILTVANKDDEVFVRLESGGGVVHGYGLAASQLMRIRDKEIPLTVAVDKVAASGGYMMACVASRVIAAPFAIIGSIGVLAQIPNFHRLLKKHDIDFEQFTAGEFKRTVTMFGLNTDEARAKFRKEVEDIHVLFKDFIVKHRPDIDIAKVSTGEHWPAIRALEHNLIDELKTSDDYLLENAKDKDLYEITYSAKKSLLEKVGFQMQKVFDRWQYGG